MLDLLIAGGPGMIPIVIASILVVAIIIERFWSLRRRVVLPEGLGDEVRAWAQERRLDPAHLDALEANSPLGAVLAAALRVRHLGHAAMRERVEDAGRIVMHGLGRFLTTLGTLALISPLLGLLGTVIGLINMFLAIMQFGTGQAQSLAGGIGEALVCTASGMAVAVPAYIFHRYFRGKVADYGIEMEREVLRLVDSLGPTAAGAVPVAATTKRVAR